MPHAGPEIIIARIEREARRNPQSGNADLSDAGHHLIARRPGNQEADWGAVDGIADPRL